MPFQTKKLKMIPNVKITAIVIIVSFKVFFFNKSTSVDVVADVECAVKDKKTPQYYHAVFWWAIRDSNPGPSGYEPDALTN